MLIEGSLKVICDNRWGEQFSSAQASMSFKRTCGSVGSSRERLSRANIVGKFFTFVSKFHLFFNFLMPTKAFVKEIMELRRVPVDCLTKD